MLHVTSTSAAISAPAFTPNWHPDVELVALIPALEAAVREQDRFDYDEAKKHIQDPAYAALIAEGRALTDAVERVAHQILEHRPKTLSGLLATARAAAAASSYLWDEDEQVGPDRGLRAVCDGLFALVGIDWRGRYIGGRPMPETDPASESAILRMLTSPAPKRTAGRTAEQPDPIFAAIEASRIALDDHIAACEAADADTDGGDARRTAAGTAAYEAWRALLAMTPTTAAGAQALARRAIDQIERFGCWSSENEEEDARTIFRAIAAAGTPDDGAPSGRAEPDPVLAAAAAHREAHISMLAARRTSAGAFDAALEQKDDALKTLLVTSPATEEGWRVYTTHALFEIARCLVDSGTAPDGWAEAAGRMLNGGEPITEDSLPPAVDGPLARQPEAQQPFLMAAE